MTCPVCEHKTTVLESRDFGDHMVRRRKCLSCKHIFFTEEIDSVTAEAEYKEFHRRDKERRKRERKGVKA